MIPKSPLLIIFILLLLLPACGADKHNAGQIATPEFFTATLPLTSTPAATFTPPFPTVIPTALPVEGITTTQVNVRAEPSTTSAALGMILPSTTVQVIGRDASGTWYQLVYPESPQGGGTGWVIAAYVQVNVGAEIPVIQIGAGSGSSASVLVVQRVNVRTGPGTQFESIGMLSPNDVVALTGKDSSGAWLQIEYASAPEGRGWINAEFVQASSAETVPVIAGSSPSVGTGTPAEAQSTPLPAVSPALEDGDSADAPSATVTFSPAGARALQFSSEVSTPQGDIEDWVQFTPYGQEVQIHVSCSGGTALLVELLTTDLASTARLACDETQNIGVQTGQAYLIHVMATAVNEPSLILYTLKVDQLH